MNKYILHAGDQPPYSPPGHSKTTNRRLLGPGTLGSERVEVVLGQIEYGGRADLHSHEGVEQAIFVLEGKARVDIEDNSAVVGPEDFLYFPPGISHRITPLEGPLLKLLILYAPPLVSSPKGE